MKLNRESDMKLDVTRARRLDEKLDEKLSENSDTKRVFRRTT